MCWLCRESELDTFVFSWRVGYLFSIQEIQKAIRIINKNYRSRLNTRFLGNLYNQFPYFRFVKNVIPNARYRMWFDQRWNLVSSLDICPIVVYNSAPTQPVPVSISKVNVILFGSDNFNHKLDIRYHLGRSDLNPPNQTDFEIFI